MDAGEDCDDGNEVNGDGCNIDCAASAAMLWEYRSGLAGTDAFRGVAAAEGMIIVGGQQKAEIGSDRWLGRFSDDGTAEWSRTYDDAKVENILGVVLGADSIYAAGNLSEQVHSIWTGSFDLAGEPGWSDGVTSDFGNAYATGIASTPEGDLVVVGLQTVQGGNGDIWLRRYGPDGAIKWTEQEVVGEPAKYSQGPGVSAGAEQIVVGYYTTAKMNHLLLAYPPEGGSTLFKLLPDEGPGPFYATTQGPDGDILTAGYVQGVGTVVDRYTSSGVGVWSTDKCVGGAGRDIEVDSQGDIVVVGDGVGSDASNIRLCKFSADGELRWGKDIDGGEGLDFGFGLAILPDDRIVAVGQMFGGEQTDYDAWLAVFSP